ncbi:HSP20-like chaperone [Backusella circina FSU 941]|nr:HSP20-like chaperone [Backusella circina FSU 941]
MPLHPTVLWAQRADVIYLTVEVADIKNHDVNVTNDKFSFKGVGEKEENQYEAEIEFYKEVDHEQSKQHLTDRNLTIIFYKKEEEYWPKLQKGSKPNYLKIDFNKWKDEDDEEETGGAPNDPMGGMGGMGGMDFASLMQQAGGGGMGGMGGPGGLPGMDMGMGGPGMGMPSLDALNAMVIV